ncbi:hypothetical protein [Pseudobutyrivibrio sp.]
MAEYITKEQIISILYAPRKAILTFEDFVTSIGNLAPVDVIERSKIDEAIEEIKQEIQNGTIKITSGNERLFNILENIGE